MNTSQPTDDDLCASYLREFDEMQQGVREHPEPFFNVVNEE
jgi:hypothetical protein